MFPLNLTEEKYVSAVEFRPSNPNQNNARGKNQNRQCVCERGSSEVSVVSLLEKMRMPTPTSSAPAARSPQRM